jgi:FAD/FMN-containing dehydrogenase
LEGLTNHTLLPQHDVVPALFVSCSVFHSTASFACPYTSDLIPAAPDSSSAAPSYVAVMTEDFNEILKVDKEAYTVTVQAGLKVLDLLR